MHCQAQVMLDNNFMDKDLIFIPTYGEESTKIHKALYKFSAEEDVKRTLTESQIKKPNTFHIYIFIENLSQKTVWFNKNFKIGTLHLIEEISVRKHRRSEENLMCKKYRSY